MDSIVQQIKDVIKKYTGLYVNSSSENGYKICGKLGFQTRIKGLEIQDIFNVEINIPLNYPDKLPIAKEVKNQIPTFFHKNKDNTLCLETPIELRILFNEQPSLLGFIDNCLIPYLAAVQYWERKGKMPFGERKHFGEGILQSYRKLFGVKDELTIFILLGLLANGDLSIRQKCFCGSSKRFGGCHKKKLKKIRRIQSKDDFYYEYKQVFLSFSNQKKIMLKDDIIDRLRHDIISLSTKGKRKIR